MFSGVLESQSDQECISRGLGSLLWCIPPHSAWEPEARVSAHFQTELRLVPCGSVLVVSFHPRVVISITAPQPYHDLNVLKHETFLYLALHTQAACGGAYL